MNNQESAKSGIVRYEVPVLAGGQYAPVSLEALESRPREDGSVDLRFVIRREAGEQIKSFALCYRFSSLTPGKADPEHPYHVFQFSNPKMNQKEQVVCKAHVPCGVEISGCTAYISRTELEDGMVFSYQASDFILPKEVSAQKNQYKQKRAEHKPRKNIHPLSIAIPILCVIALVAGGVYLRYVALGRTVNGLLEQKRYNEAYRLAQDAMFDGLQQNVCRTACDYYLEIKDYAQAYTYAAAAPEPFGHSVAVKAAYESFDPETGEIIPEMFLVAQRMEVTKDYDTLMNQVMELYLSKNQYHVAMRAALSMKGEQTRLEAATQVFLKSVRYYIDSGRYEDAISFMTSFAQLVPDSGLVADELAQSCLAQGDTAGAIYLTSLLHEDSSGIEVAPDDASVRSDLAKTYFLLTPNQMRSYHARKIAVGTELFCPDANGTLAAYNQKDVVSVSAHDYHTLVLFRDGRAAALTNGKHNLSEVVPTDSDIVAVSAGGYHSVYLHADGSVTAYGDNTYGQCDVTAWRNVVAVAAGYRFTVALRSDGTLLACGSNACGQCDIGGYRNVVDVAATNQAAVILFSDGTVAVQGETSMGLSAVSAFTDVSRIRAGSTCIVAQKKDGSFVMASGINAGDFGTVNGWRDILDFDVGSVCIAAVKQDGTVLTDGDNKPAQR